MAKRIQEWVRVAEKNVQHKDGPMNRLETPDGSSYLLGDCVQLGEVGSIYIHSVGEGGENPRYQRPNKKQMAKCPFK